MHIFSFYFWFTMSFFDKILIHVINQYSHLSFPSNHQTVSHLRLPSSKIQIPLPLRLKQVRPDQALIGLSLANEKICKLEPGLWPFIGLFFFVQPDIFKSLVWSESLFTDILIIKVFKHVISSTSKYAKQTVKPISLYDLSTTIRH